MDTKKILFGLILFSIFHCNLYASTDSNRPNKPTQIIIQLRDNITIRSNDGNLIFPVDIIALNKKHDVISITPVFKHIPEIKAIKTKYLQRSMRVANKSFEDTKYNLNNFLILSFKEHINTEDIIDDYKNHPKILSAEPNRIIYAPFNPKNTDKISNDYIKLINAENIQHISLGSPSVIIAVLDSGADTSHPAIFNRLWINKKEKHEKNDDDLNGFIDDINGFNFQNFSNDITDHYGHGTFIAGIIGALPIDNTNIQGMNRYSPVMPVKVISKNGQSNISTFSQGLYYAINNGADIINISLDIKTKNSALLKSMLDYAYETGCIIVIPENPSNESACLAKYKNIISVVQYNSEPKKNIPDNTIIDISAPDRQITSLRSKNFLKKNIEPKSRYITTNKSYACTAIVSATVSLMLSINAGLYVDEIKNIIKNTSSKPNEDMPLLNCKKALDESYITRDQLVQDLLNPVLTVQQKSLKKITVRGDSLVAFLIEQSCKVKTPLGEKGILIHTLGEIKSNTALPYLIDMLQSEDNNYLKRNIIEAIGKIGDPDTLNILLDALNDSNAGVRYKAAMALGRLGIKNAGPNLMDKLNDPDERVVTESIESLTKIRYKKSISHFTEEINNTFTDQFVKDQMVFAIGELGDKSSLSALFLYKKNILTGEPANNIVKYKWNESIKTVNEAIKKIESRNE